MKMLLTACAIFMIIVIFSIITFVSKQGLETFKMVSPIEYFTSSYWSPFEEQFGILTFIKGTLLLTGLSTLIGGVLGVGCAIFISKFAPKFIKNILRFTVEIFVGIPSVVYGYIGLTVVVPLIRRIFSNSVGFGILPASLILSVMIMPTVITISEDSINSVDISFEEASYALGATKIQTIFGVILPCAFPGIISSIILAMARALGETMAVQMVIGNTPQLANSLLEPTSSLTTAIVMDIANTEFGSTWNNALFMMATVLLVISIIFILFARKLNRRSMR
ncbi:phosphate ABC transporter permease [Fervidicella metallireducens AeB]|uniref:Phosphate transport system permease protein n=1 Tax=Fervidicella metallireducens AeB TaxID=1403537 RepID=A0A017RX29_9CLOT|nr:phosphate ABC transporter permease [Fervidicella metallireducens AeB]